MNYKLVLKILGFIMIIEAAFMLLPMAVGFIYGENDWIYFLATIVPCAAAGIIMFLIKTEKKSMFAKEGYITVALAWILMSLVAAVPFCVSGFIPNYFNAVFESISGFTTSGITIAADVESASHAILFWRSLTHWIGGMGVLVFMLAIAPVAGGSSLFLMKAESPGPSTEKITPKISQTAKWFYGIYLVLTVAQTLALMAAGMPLFESILISFGTIATGGFSYLNSSAMTFPAPQLIIITVFMLLAGVNFSLYFLAITGRLKKAAKDVEVRWYLAIMAAGMVLLTVSVYASHSCGSFGNTLLHSVFAAASAMTSTGFAAADYNAWPWFAKNVVILLMFVGGCAGSTAGGFKVSRVVITFKTIKQYIKETFHPRSVNTVKYNGKTLDGEIIRTTSMYFALFTMIFIISVFIVMADPKMDLNTALAAVTTTLNNNGIEFKSAGIGGFAELTWLTRLVYMADMLIGRLEILPVMVLVAQAASPAAKLRRYIRRKRQK